MRFSNVSHALAQPVRYRVLTRYLARIGLVVIALRLVPISVAWLNGDWAFMINQLITLTVLSAICLPLSRIQAPEGITNNEVMVISALSFFLSAASDCIPFIGEGLSDIDAFFEAVSAVTTTGLSTMSQIQRHSAGFLFARSWMQWYGGLGIIVFSVGLLFLDKGLAARRLAMGDIGDSRDILGNARAHSVKLLAIYCALTVFAISLLSMAGVPPLSAVTHALSGVSTGGFSIYDSSLTAIEPWSIQFMIVLCGVLGAVSLPFYYRFVQNGIQELSFNLEIRALLVLSILVIGLLFFCSGESDANVLLRLKHAVIMGLSAQTTTGFTNVDAVALDNGSKLSLIFSMLVGGSIGSTAGGIKILRLLIVLRLLQFFIQRTALPAHAVLERHLSNDKLEYDEIEKALMLILIFMGTVLCSWLPFLMAGYDPLNALFEVVSACSTTGLSAGITRTELEPGLKVVLIVDMLLGRVEFLAFLVFLYPRTWIKVGS
ncbi:MAG: potassium transporter TrkG [Methylobacter sp.]|nr:potassium transporter TrkG [Methylobacter sp.]